jgi:hypothetical protein
MRALVLGARGAVGAVAADALRAAGHHVTGAGRTPGPGVDLRLDLRAPDGLARVREAAAEHDVVLHASAVEDPALARAVGRTPLVDASATGRYLDGLAAAVAPGGTLVLGAGLVPGLSTVLVASLDARPGDEIDVAVLLGTGETHGDAAVAWTAGLAGAALHDPPEGGTVMNLRSARVLPTRSGARRLLRADFPDHVLVGRARGVTVRSHLAAGGAATTAALALVGRFPALRALVARVPHVGDDRWEVGAVHRRTGERVAAHGRGQSAATGLLAARAVEAAAAARGRGVVTSADLLTLDDVARVPGVRLG